MTTIHLSILPRTARGNGGDRIIGVDAPSGVETGVHLAHILFRRVGDDRLTGYALGYVMAHLIAGALRSTEENARPTIVYGNRRIAERMLNGTPAFTRDELRAIVDGVKSLAQ